MGPCWVNYRDIFNNTAGNLSTITVNVSLSMKTLHHSVNFHISLFRTARARIHSSLQFDPYRIAHIFHVSLQCVFSIHVPFALLQQSRQLTKIICFDLLLKMWLGVVKRYK